MWEHAFPELIESFEDLTDVSAIQAFIDAAHVAGAERIAETALETLTDEDLAECERFQGAIVAAEARLAALAEVEAERKAKIASLSFKRASAPPPAAPAPVVTPTPDAPNTGNAGPGFQVTPQIVTTSEIAGFKAGTALMTRREQGEALLERAKRVGRSGNGERFPVLKVQGYIPDDLKMPEKGNEMFAFLQNDRYDEDGLVAGFCAPAPNDLGFCGGSPDTRPVLGALRRYQAPRGRVNKIQTPLFSDVGTGDGEIDTTGLGVWTNADDDADPFVQKTCSIMTCPTDELFELYAIYKCITIKNFMQLAFPEWVAWYLQQLDAHWARDAEVSLLNQMLVRAGAAITATATYGAMASLVSRLNQLMNNYVENERYDDAGLVAFAPRWGLRQMQNDAIRRGQTLSRSQIESAIMDTGITKVVWTYDNPTAYNDVQQQAKGTALEDFPTNFWMILTKGDNLRVMDFAARDIGITTEKTYRDTTSTVNNDFQMFVESFEGIIDMGCPVWRFQIPLCDNGLIAPTSGYDAKPCGSPDETDVVPTGA